MITRIHEEIQRPLKEREPQGKFCSSCGELKPLKDFTGRYAQCKPCRAVKQKAKDQCNRIPDGMFRCYRCKAVKATSERFSPYICQSCHDTCGALPLSADVACEGSSEPITILEWFEQAGIAVPEPYQEPTPWKQGRMLKKCRSFDKFMTMAKAESDAHPILFDCEPIMAIRATYEEILINLHDPENS